MNPENLLLSLDAPAPGPMGSPWVMMLAFVAIFYFVLLRPQQKEQKEHQTLIAGLQKGDRVVTGGGLHGKIHEAKGETLVLEVSAGTFLTVERSSVARKVVETPVVAEKA